MTRSRYNSRIRINEADVFFVWMFWVSRPFETVVWPILSRYLHERERERETETERERVIGREKYPDNAHLHLQALYDFPAETAH